MADMRYSPSGKAIKIPSTDDSRVPDLASLALVPGDSAAELIWVESLLCYFRRDETSTAASDGITIIPAVGGGNWHRQVYLGASEWLGRTDWYVDGALGDDENPGTVGAPIKSFNELSRRWMSGYLIPNEVRVYVSGAFATNERLEYGFERSTVAKVVRLIGATNIVASDTVDAYTPSVNGPPAEGSLLKGLGIADWTPHVGRRVLFLGNGAICWVAKANPSGLGNDVARISPPARMTSPSSTVTVSYSPVFGEAFIIETLVSIPKLYIAIRSAGASNTSQSLRIENLDVLGITIDGREAVAISGVIDGCVVRQFSYYGPTFCVKGQQSFERLYIPRCSVGAPTPGSNYSVMEGYATAERCLFRGQHNPVKSSKIEIRYSLFQGPGNGIGLGVRNTTISNQWSLHSAGAPTVLLNNTQFFDWGYAIAIDSPCRIRVDSTLSGADNSYGMGVGPYLFGEDMLSVQWDSALPPSLPGTVADVRIMGTDFAWADVKYCMDEQCGTVALVGGVATVPSRFSNSRQVILSRNTPGGTLGHLSAPFGARTASEFVIESSEVLDTSTVDWKIPGNGIPIFVGNLNDQTCPR